MCVAAVVSEEAGLFAWVDRALGASPTPLDSRRICGHVLFCGSCAVLVYYGHVLVSLRRLAASTQSWSAMQRHFAEGTPAATAEERDFYHGAALYHRQKRRAPQSAEATQRSRSYNEVLSRACAQQLVAYMEVPWVLILVVLTSAWWLYTLQKWLLGARIDLPALSTDLVVATATPVLLATALVLLLFARCSSRRSIRVLAPSEVAEEDPLLGLCQACALVSAVCTAYLLGRAAAVLRERVVPLPGTGEATFSLDSGSAWLKYVAALGCNALVLVCVLPRLLCVLPRRTVLFGQRRLGRAKSD